MRVLIDASACICYPCPQLSDEPWESSDLRTRKTWIATMAVKSVPNHIIALTSTQESCFIKVPTKFSDHAHRAYLERAHIFFFRRASSRRDVASSRPASAKAANRALFFPYSTSPCLLLCALGEVFRQRPMLGVVLIWEKGVPEVSASAPAF
jgi:hypothetical protein